MLHRPALFVLCVLLAAGLPAGAQSPPPSPAPTAAAFAARAHADVTIVTGNGTFGGSAVLGVAQRDGLVRVELISLTSDAVSLPPVGATVVIDRRANTLTVWNDATKRYRVQALLPRPGSTAAPRPSPRARATAAPAVGASPFAKLDVLELSVKLTGHGTTAGIATTGLALDMQVRKRGETATSHVTVTTQLADDYPAFPVQLDATAEPGGGGFRATMTYAVDEFTPGAPPLARFTVPAGYTRAASLVDVVMPRRGT